MKTFRTLLFFCLTVVACGAASGQTVTSNYDEDYGLARLVSYGFKAQERRASDPLATDTLMERQVKKALEDALQGKGYYPTSDGSQPNFLVAFYVVAEDKTVASGAGANYVQGALVVDFHDAETGKVVWRGVATAAVGAQAVDLKRAEDLVERAAEELLEQFGRDRLGL